MTIPLAALYLEADLILSNTAVSLIAQSKVILLVLSHWGPVRRPKPVNTGSHKHVTET